MGSNISETFGRMFYDTPVEVSGTSVPTYYLATENGVLKKPHVLSRTSSIPDDKDPSKTQTVTNSIYDLEANNISAPMSLFSDFKLFHYSGITGFMYPGDPNVTTKYFDNKAARSGLMWANMEPTYANIIDAYKNIEAAAYKIQDFVYNKYFNKIPPNYLITLRRYANACDDIPFTLGWDENLHQQLYPTSVQIPISTATTYISETAGNKMEDILKFTFGTNWADQESEIQILNSATPGATGFGLGQRLYMGGAGTQRDGDRKSVV